MWQASLQWQVPSEGSQVPALEQVFWTVQEPEEGSFSQQLLHSQKPPDGLHWPLPQLRGTVHRPLASAVQHGSQMQPPGEHWPLPHEVPLEHVPSGPREKQGFEHVHVGWSPGTPSSVHWPPVPQLKPAVQVPFESRPQLRRKGGGKGGKRGEG